VRLFHFVNELQTLCPFRKSKGFIVMFRSADYFRNVPSPRPQRFSEFKLSPVELCATWLHIQLDALSMLDLIEAFLTSHFLKFMSLRKKSKPHIFLPIVIETSFHKIYMC